MIVKETEIKAPWGHVAVKLWGNEDDPAILSVHGLQDNAGTFDRLIPLLPQRYYYICVDLPGHGKSSHFPPHLPIHTINYVLVYTLVMDYFKRSKYIIMGHSYGGQLGLHFAQLYPERVEKLIMYDTIYFWTVSTKYLKDYLTERFESFSKTEEKLKTRRAPQYSYQEAFDKLLQVRPFPLSEDAAKVLLPRMLVPQENGKYELSMDQRLKHIINPSSDVRYVVESLKKNPVRCPILIIFGVDNYPQRYALKHILDVLKKQKNVTVKYVPGNHDVHNTDADKVAPIVAKFLSVQKSKL